MTIHDQFRAEALGHGFSESEVERWTPLVRPCGVHREDGQRAGHFGGPIMVPAEVDDRWFPLVATIDCAAVPPEVTDLALPSDGQLLFFGYPEEDGMGDVVYVPSGAAVQERALHPDAGYDEDFPEIVQELQRGDIHLVPRLSLPFVDETEAVAEALAQQWGDPAARFLLGGYGTEFDSRTPAEWAAEVAARQAKEGPRSDRATDSDHWALLAELNVYRSGGGATMFWAIHRDDLAACRFDQAQFVVDWNP
ncbi:protein of unknown function [Lentzea waywayandensis]|uniref:DUF1963 domain-containing protein n=1 Tax=Lentzea waywayandensis TaxID=84724 RepID=A0A1I6FDJ3_9PSEU|nr:DUF1963 domain-containing protein [Lentzea waywayandensis]SFR27980.1 protein of unknown function [Lentzea waywayandensis]